MEKNTTRGASADRWHPSPSTVVVSLLEDVWNRATDGFFISHYAKDVQRVGVEVCGGNLFFRRGKFAFCDSSLQPPSHTLLLKDTNGEQVHEGQWKSLQANR